MSKRWSLVVIMLMLVGPSVQHAKASGLKQIVTIKSSTVGIIIFDHIRHGLECKFCHPKIFKKRPARRRAATMKQMEKGRSCGACHNGKKAFNGKTAFSVKGDCVTCHAKATNILYTAGNIGTISFPHSTHLEMFTCNDCHPLLFSAQGSTGKNKRRKRPVSMKEMESGNSCGACHNGDDAFNVTGDCLTCHVTPNVVLFESKYFGSVTFPHSVHMEMSDCRECHPSLFKPLPRNEKRGNRLSSMKDMESGKSCGACHNGDEAFAVTGDCLTCHEAPSDILFTSKYFGSVTFPHSGHMEMSDCKKCHPFLFKPISREGRRIRPISMKEMEEGRSCGGCHNGDDAFGVTGDCLTCHADASDIIFEDKDIGNVTFPHSVHIEMSDCRECHPDRYQAKRGAKENKATMKEMESGSSCGACHNGDDAFGVTGDCLTCHADASDIIFEDKDIGNVTFPHSVHIEMSDCRECHPDRYQAKRGAKENKATMKEMESGSSCGACHNGDDAFGVTGDCLTCHADASDIIFEDKDIGNVTFPHSVHIEMSDCRECHPDRYQAKRGAKENKATMKEMESGKSCGGCHNGDEAFGVTGDCLTCHADASDIIFEDKDIGNVTFPHSVHIEMSDCRECHPDRYQAKRGAKENKATMKEMESGKSCGGCHNGDEAFGVTGDCLTCHADASDIIFEDKDIGNVTFPHSVHIEMSDCRECHPDRYQAKRGAKENKATMKEMESGKSCGGCHNGDEAFGVTGDCLTCHADASDIIFEDKDIGSVTFPHSVHIEMSDCRECHPDRYQAKRGAKENKATMKEMESGSSCGGCHNGDEAFGVTGDCLTCHADASDIIFEDKDIGNVTFPHSVHIEMSDCRECHPDRYQAKRGAKENKATMKEMESGKSCGGCHNGDEAFGVTGDCLTCHADASDIIFEDKDIGSVTFPHSVHIEMSDCRECHPDRYQAKRGAKENKATMKEMESGKSCGGCHNGDEAFGVTGDCLTCHADASDIIFEDKDIGSVTFPHSVHIEMSDCRECHPDRYQAKRGAKENKATMKEMESGKSCGACHNGDDAFDVADNCESCHQM